MDAQEQRIGKVFSNGGNVQYLLPYFQRDYAWEQSNWKTLLDDLFQLNEEGKDAEHFMGALVVIDEGSGSGIMPRYTLVDGQQRLTTLSILIRVLSEQVREDEHLHRTMNKMLVNPDERGSEYFKVVPTEKRGDRQAYFNILRGERPQGRDSQILDAYEFYLAEVPKRLQRGEKSVRELFDSLINSMQVVFIVLNKRERPYKIFESLNAKGRALSQSDLVRNYIAMRLPSERQKQVFDKHWVKIEDTLDERRKTAKIGELTAFLRHYLAHHSGVLPRTNDVYARFRDRMESYFVDDASFEEEIRRLHQFACYYDRLLRPDLESDNELRTQIKRLNRFEMSSSYPLWIYLYHQVELGKTTTSEFKKTLLVFENYFVRRFLAGDPTNFNKLFPTLVMELRDRGTDSASEFLRRALVHRNYPSDSRLGKALHANRNFDSRRQKRLVLILESLNRHLSKDADGHTVLADSPTIEHIMPQNLTHWWRSQFGRRHDEVHKDYVNAIGNLTLVTQSWNSALSNGEFRKKQNKLRRHALRINSEYFSRSIRRWDAKAIGDRTSYLTKLILKVWPNLGASVDAYDVKGTKPVSLTISGKSYPVKSWREVLVQTVSAVSNTGIDFEAMTERFPPRFFKHESIDDRDYRSLENGWSVYTNRTAQHIVDTCAQLVAYANFSDADWQVEYR